uniref:Major facilitator superfamily (MFS) profile domain-containing protein n=1 Tax=Bionectria ochroleuca TaxID=29856 RepID=A0A0B7JWW8_BIOOC
MANNDILKGRLGRWNVAHRLEKSALLNSVCFVAGISIFFFGYDQGLMGGVNTARNYVELMGFGHWDEEGQIVVIDEPVKQGFINACYYLPGTLVGCLLGGWLGDRYGRTTTIGMACVWSVLTAALQSAAMNSSWMISARVLNGIGTGILNAVTPVWATETAAHTSRGAFISIEFTLNILGVIVAYWLQFGTSKMPNQQSSFIWRFPIAFQIVPLIALFTVIWFMPESPRWLVKVGRVDEARYILQRLRGSEGEDGEAAEAEVQDIVRIHGMEEETSSQQSYWAMFWGVGSGKLHTGRRVQLVVWLQILQEWVGIAGITIYGPTIFTIAGISSQDRLWVSGLNNITYMFATLVRAKGNAWGVVGWSIGNGWCVLLLPTIFDRLNEKTLYIFGGVNIFCIAVVWALYPESNQRTLEEMNLVFSSDSIWAWDAEREFARLKQENPELVQAAARRGSHAADPEMGERKNSKAKVATTEKVELSSE